MSASTQASTQKKTSCYHCGEDCTDEKISSSTKTFCCEGCKMVFEILNKNDLCEYYDLDKNPGLSQKIKVRAGKFAILDNPEICNKLIHFSDGDQKHVTFYLPQMHCSSCIWLLEHLTKINRGIYSSRVDFLKKEVTVNFNNNKISLKQVAELLASIGYEPHISLNDMKDGKLKTYDRSRIYKIGIAGFCFGNIMMFSFPEYFSSGDIQEKELKFLFNFLNLGLALPVFFYCASEFFISAYKGLKQKFLNIDAPIALAILITFGRSVFEIVTDSGAGYLDSMSGIVFFMLVGRFFQDKTYQSLTFDRDYTSYFPIGVTVITSSGEEIQKPVSKLKVGDRIRVHSHEIIPADGILFYGHANIDYSFVTGESIPSEKQIGEIIYSGGKQIGSAIEIEIVKEVSQSYLTQLWNNEVFKKKKDDKQKSFVHQVSRYFTYILFSIAIATAVYWTINDPSVTWTAVTAILIVACPCALLLSATFTNGNMLTKLQGANFFVKNAGVLEDLAQADTIVFDKTGTLSLQQNANIDFKEGHLSDYEKQLVRALAAQSNHPLSKSIVASICPLEKFKIKNFIEEKGSGSAAIINNEYVKLGSELYIRGSRTEKDTDGSRVYISINDEVLGYFHIQSVYRAGLKNLIVKLKKNSQNRGYKLALLSGDNDSEKEQLQHIFGNDCELLFEQSPQNKLDYILELQNKGHKVMMIGDGLNDAGALQQSNAGIAITDDVNNFSPACDAILDGKEFSKLDRLLKYCRKEKTIIYGSFVISILYNIVGVTYAVQGILSPVIAAILMPASSISIVLYTTLASSFFFQKIKK